jgi:hypothetical protein
VSERGTVYSGQIVRPVEIGERVGTEKGVDQFAEKDGAYLKLSGWLMERSLYERLKNHRDFKPIQPPCPNAGEKDE